jgi:HTH-type transcriptional regulator/antitoxin HigA
MRLAQFNILIENRVVHKVDKLGTGGILFRKLVLCAGLTEGGRSSAPSFQHRRDVGKLSTNVDNSQKRPWMRIISKGRLREFGQKYKQAGKECIYRVWPLRSEIDYLSAREIVDRLAIKGEERLTAVELDQLEIFTILIEKYEDEHYGIKPLNLPPIEFLKILMRESGMNSSDLGKLLGDRSLGHRILKGERSLSKKHIKILSEHFKVDAGAFL